MRVRRSGCSLDPNPVGDSTAMTHRPRRRDHTRAPETHSPLVAVVAASGPATVVPARIRPARGSDIAPSPRRESLASVPVGVARTPAGTLRPSLETVLYVALIAAAVLTRFWDLGKRALHHDESLHAYYSWVLSQGQGYRHDPLMHGPFLFEANALVYLLFGDSDASTRFLPALTGVLIVAAPWLLRSPELLGRAGALTASFLLLISPTFFYYTRYIRHDPYTALGSIVLFASILRYRQAPERRWVVAGGVTLAVLFANHEIVFALVAIFGGFVWGALLWGRLRPLLPVHIAAAALLGATVVLVRQFADPLPAIPWDEPTGEMERGYYVDLFTHPLTIAVLLVGLAFVAACVWVVRDERRRHDGAGMLDGAEAGSTAAAVLAARRDGNGLGIAALAGLGLFVAMFTTFFTNLGGLATGTIATDGTLLYWLGQQGEQRGSQPWFFYLILAPQYEFLAILLGGIGVAVAAVHTVRAVGGRRRAAPRLFVRLFLATWLVLILAGLSYAGEKMPWLLMHITLPAALLGGLVIDDLSRRWRAGAAPHAGLFGRVAPSWSGPAFLAAIVAAGGAWFLLAGRLTYGEFDRVADGPLTRVVTDNAQDRWWLLALPPLAVAALLGGSWLWRGSRSTGRTALLALVLLLALLQVHASWRLSYLDGDTPVDMLMYNQTSPDVTRMMSEMGTLSAELYGAQDLVVWYDGFTAWPMQWYLRDFANRHYYTGALEGPPTLDGTQADILIVANDNIASVEGWMAGYTPQAYVLRWHFPEEGTYRNFAIAPELDPGLSAWREETDPHGPIAVAGSVAESFGTQLEPEGQQRVYRLVMFRDLPIPIRGFDYTVYVRDDLVPLFNTIRY